MAESDGAFARGLRRFTSTARRVNTISCHHTRPLWPGVPSRRRPSRASPWAPRRGRLGPHGSFARRRVPSGSKLRNARASATVESPTPSFASESLRLPRIRGGYTSRGRHLKMIVASMSDRPHAARRWLIVIRKMIGAALDEEWIESDPAHRLKYRPPPTHCWRAWTAAEREAFAKRWTIGTTPRLCYALALWLGPRRKDIAALATASIEGDSITFTTHDGARCHRPYPAI